MQYHQRRRRHHLATITCKKEQQCSIHRGHTRSTYIHYITLRSHSERDENLNSTNLLKFIAVLIKIYRHFVFNVFSLVFFFCCWCCYVLCIASELCCSFRHYFQFSYVWGVIGGFLYIFYILLYLPKCFNGFFLTHPFGLFAPRLIYPAFLRSFDRSSVQKYLTHRTAKAWPTVLPLYRRLE